MNRDAAQRQADLHARRRDTWLRVYHHEITRRKNLLMHSPKNYKMLFRQNPKGLLDMCPKDKEHIWLPAMTLWIHDNPKKGGKGYSLIEGIYRRGLHEALTYTLGERIYCPQMCSRCIATREYVTEKWYFGKERERSPIETLEERKGKGKVGRPVMVTDLGDLFA